MLAANAFYRATSPRDVQALSEQFAALFGRPYLHLARPGILGSSGHHRDRRRPREVALVDAALTRLKERFGWTGSTSSASRAAAIWSRR